PGAVAEPDDPRVELGWARVERTVRRVPGEAHVVELEWVPRETVALHFVARHALAAGRIHHSRVLDVDRSAGDDSVEPTGGVPAGRVRVAVLGEEAAILRPMLGADEQWHERAPVHRPAGPVGRARLRMGQAEDGRGEIDVGHGPRDALDRPLPVEVALWRLDHEREMQRLTIREHLSLLDPMLAEELTVVRDEDEYGAPEQSRALQG